MICYVYASPGVPEYFQQIFPGQSKHHGDESEREKLLHKKIVAYWHQVFFIKGRVDREELSIAYCPTHNMLSDYLTKPLQGKLLHKFRYIVMVRFIPFTLVEDKIFT